MSPGTAAMQAVGSMQQSIALSAAAVTRSPPYTQYDDSEQSLTSNRTISSLTFACRNVVN